MMIACTSGMYWQTPTCTEFEGSRTSLARWGPCSYRARGEDVDDPRVKNACVRRTRATVATFLKHRDGSSDMDVRSCRTSSVPGAHVTRARRKRGARTVIAVPNDICNFMRLGNVTNFSRASRGRRLGNPWCACSL